MSKKREEDETVGHYVKETGYAFGKPPMKPLKSPSDVPSTVKILDAPEMNSLVARMQAAAADAASSEAEPPSCEACGGATSICNEQCRCGDTHHYCVCACHLRQEQWAIATARRERERECARERERLRVAALTEHEKHREQRHPDYEYLTTENARKQPGGDPPPNERWEPNDIVECHLYKEGVVVEERWCNWERFEFTETNYWRRKKAVEAIP